jgi:hypothetical protein
VAETVDRIVGYVSDPEVSEKLHKLSHQGVVEKEKAPPKWGSLFGSGGS